MYIEKYLVIQYMLWWKAFHGKAISLNAVKSGIIYFEYLFKIKKYPCLMEGPSIIFWNSHLELIYSNSPYQRVIYSKIFLMILITLVIWNVFDDVFWWCFLFFFFFSSQLMVQQIATTGGLFQILYFHSERHIFVSVCSSQLKLLHLNN